MSSVLFSPLKVGGLSLANRIVIAPMCQYSATDGAMNDWHLQHLGQLAQSGAGALTIEATAVLPEGRITYADVGLYDDATEAAMGRVLDGVRRWSDMPIVIQISHAGRKASHEVPWKGGALIAPDQELGWNTVSSSAVPTKAGGLAPAALDDEGIARIVEGFAEAARRSARLGIDGIQLHAAHGYLLHQFMSPLVNQRTDQYGGDLENRIRLLLEAFDATRANFPADKPVTVRISATDWIPGGWDIDQSIVLAKALAARGCDAIHVSSGGVDPARQAIPVGPSYQVPLARAIKQAVDIPVVAVGLIADYDQAEAIVATGDADMIALARGILYDPRWPWHAAAHLGASIPVADQYLRAQPRRYPDLFTPRPR